MNFIFDDFSADNRKENKQYDLCSECGQLHSADEDSNDESEQEICPDCGVPHNPFKHPPSPSSKVSECLLQESVFSNDIV